jgi:MSHA biogenesis protein MshQ
VQYLNVSGKYAINTQVNCTTFDASEISLTSGTLDKNLTGVNTITSQLEEGETRAMLLTAPGAENQGTVLVEYEIYDWLKYDWTWNGVDAKVLDENPSAVATFGLFRGNDRIIYQREVNN